MTSSTSTVHSSHTDSSPQFLRPASSVGWQARHVRVQRRSAETREWELVAVYRRAEDAEARANELVADGEDIRLVSFLYCPSAR